MAKDEITKDDALTGIPVIERFWRRGLRLNVDSDPALQRDIFLTPNKLWVACQQYFDWCLENPLIREGSYVARPFTIQGLRAFLGVTATKWSSMKKEERFGFVIERVDDIIASQQYSYAAVGVYNASLVSKTIFKPSEEAAGSGVSIHIHKADSEL